MDKTISNMFSLVIGIGIGIGIGVIIAPKSGKETRSDIREKFDDIYETGKEKAETMIAKGKEIAGKIKHKQQQDI